MEEQEIDKEALLNEAKNAIDEYLGDNVNYQIITEAEDSDYSLDHDDMILYFPDYDISNEFGEIDDSKIMEFAKCWFGLDKALNALNKSGFVYCNRVDHYPLYSYHPALPERGYYTLEELFAMDDDKFMQLVDKKSGYQAFDFYDYIREIASARSYDYSWEIPYITGSLMTLLQPDMDYVPGETEKMIEDVLGDTVKYEIESPDIPIVYEQYGNLFSVNFPDYNSDLYEYESDEWKSAFKNEKVIEMAKIVYCVRQVFDIGYNNGAPLMPGPGPVEPTEDPTEVTTETTTTTTSIVTTAKATTKATTTTPIVTTTKATTKATTTTPKATTTKATTKAVATTPIVTTTKATTKATTTASIVTTAKATTKATTKAATTAPIVTTIKTTEAIITTEPLDTRIPFVTTTENVSEEKITDVSAICNMINEEITKERIPGKAEIDTETNNAVINLDAETGNGRSQKWLENYIEEKNIDSSKVKFIVVDIYQTCWFRDVNDDGEINVRDCAYIASKLAKGEKLSDRADYNSDGKANVRDAAALASSLSKKQID